MMFFIGVVLFMPKINLYYTLENLLKKEHIEVREGSLKDRWIDLKIEDALVLYDGIESVQAQSITLSPWLVYNKLTMDKVTTTQTLKSILDIQVDEATMTYAVWDYKYVQIDASGDFGVIHGTLDVMEEKIHLILEPSDAYKNHALVRQYFKKSEEGMVYESKL